MIKTVRRGKQTWTLAFVKSLQSTLDYISWSQAQCGIFRSVTTRPYHGKQWNPDKVVWIVEG